MGDEVGTVEAPPKYNNDLVFDLKKLTQCSGGCRFWAPSSCARHWPAVPTLRERLVRKR